MKRVVMVVVIILALAFLLAAAAYAYDVFGGKQTMSMLGYWNPQTQMFCTYPLYSVPSICQYINPELLPSDIPQCPSFTGGKYPPIDCKLVRIEIDSEWSYYEW